MAAITEETSMKEINAMEGVKDLPMIVRGKFIKALRCEARGDHAEADQFLNMAIEEEEKLKNAKKK